MSSMKLMITELLSCNQSMRIRQGLAIVYFLYTRRTENCRKESIDLEIVLNLPEKLPWILVITDFVINLTSQINISIISTIGRETYIFILNSPKQRILIVE